MPMTFQVKVFGWVFMHESQARQMISGQRSSSSAEAQAAAGHQSQEWDVLPKFSLIEHKLRIISKAPWQLAPSRSPMGMSSSHQTQAQCLP